MFYCKHCNLYKEYDLMSKDKTHSLGIRSICKDCRQKRKKSYKNYKSYKSEKHLKLLKEIKEKNSLKRKRILFIKILKKYQKNYKIIKTKMGNRHCYACKQYLNPINKWFSKTSKTKIGFDSICIICSKLKNAKTQRKRLIKAGKNRNKRTKETLTYFGVWKVFKRFNFQCFNCNDSELKNLTIDHNNNDIKLTHSNAVILCKKCNTAKCQKRDEDFYSVEKLLSLRSILGVNNNYMTNGYGTPPVRKGTF